MSETALVQKTCIPCHGGVSPLSQMPGREDRNNRTKIEARSRFKKFRAALDFVHRAGDLAEAEIHHPVSITFGWGYADVVLQTKKINGLRENDFIVAAKINEIAEKLFSEARD